MRNRWICGITVILTFMVLFFSQPLYTCTTFCFRHQGAWVFGRNYDWNTGHCLIMVNKRGVSKQAFGIKNPARWVSRYGSITFNQYGREFPLGGMNEAGLVVECMWLQGSRYPAPDPRPSLTELQWIQYQLDNFSRVKEVIHSDTSIRIDAETSVPLHFLVCDVAGHAAAIEFLQGKMVVHTGPTLPAAALANSTYAHSRQALEEVQKNPSLPIRGNSQRRFIWAARGIDSWNKETSASPVDYAFGILEKVAVRRTMFRIVYDVKNRGIYFRAKSNRAVRFVDFNRFDFRCRTPVKVLDISSGKGGDAGPLFSDYTFEANYELMRKTWRETDFLKNRPESQLKQAAQYPQTQTACRN